MSNATPGAPSAPDLSQYQLQEVGICTLKNARGDDDLRGIDREPVTAEIFSPGSAQGRKADHKFNRPQQLRMFRMARGEVVSSDQVDSEREVKQRRIDVLKSFSPNFPFSPEQVFGDPLLYYIGAQIDAFYAKAGNFEKGSSPS
jgi:hypothetical protein